MDITSLSLMLAVLLAWSLVTVALDTGGFKVRRHHPRHQSSGLASDKALTSLGNTSRAGAFCSRLPCLVV